jgi:hypothetical protein
MFQQPNRNEPGELSDVMRENRKVFNSGALSAQTARLPSGSLGEKRRTFQGNTFCSKNSPTECCKHGLNGVQTHQFYFFHLNCCTFMGGIAMGKARINNGPKGKKLLDRAWDALLAAGIDNR